MTPQNDTADEPETGIELEEPLRDSSGPGIAFSVLVLLVGAWFFIQALEIHSNAAIWPRTLSVLLIVLSAIRIVTALFDRRRIGAAGVDEPPRPASWRDPDTARRLFTASWLVAYCVTGLFFGFGWPMLVFLPVYMWVAAFRRPLAILIITALVAIGLTLLFDSVVGVRMWEFEP